MIKLSKSVVKHSQANHVAPSSHTITIRSGLSHLKPSSNLFRIWVCKTRTHEPTIPPTKGKTNISLRRIQHQHLPLNHTSKTTLTLSILWSTRATSRSSRTQASERPPSLTQATKNKLTQYHQYRTSLPKHHWTQVNTSEKLYKQLSEQLIKRHSSQAGAVARRQPLLMSHQETSHLPKTKLIDDNCLKVGKAKRLVK